MGRTEQSAAGLGRHPDHQQQQAAVAVLGSDCDLSCCSHSHCDSGSRGVLVRGGAAGCRFAFADAAEVGDAVDAVDVSDFVVAAADVAADGYQLGRRWMRTSCYDSAPARLADRAKRCSRCSPTAGVAACPERSEQRTSPSSLVLVLGSAAGDRSSSARW